MVILWLSEIITEKGIGNGSSIIITANILSGLPIRLKRYLIQDRILILLNILSFTVLITGIIYVQEAVRVIPLISAKQLFSQMKINKNIISAIENKSRWCNTNYSFNSTNIFNHLSNYLKLKIFSSISHSKYSDFFI